MAKAKRKNSSGRRQSQQAANWSLRSLGIIIVVILVAILWLLVLMRNGAEEYLQNYGISESQTLEQLSADIDTIDVDVLDAQTQLLPEE